MDLRHLCLQLAKIRKNWLVHDFVVRKQRWIEVLGVEDEQKYYPGAALIPFHGRQRGHMLDVTRLPQSREREIKEDAVEDAPLRETDLLGERREAVDVNTTIFTILHLNRAVAELRGETDQTLGLSQRPISATIDGRKSRPDRDLGVPLHLVARILDLAGDHLRNLLVVDLDVAVDRGLPILSGNKSAEKRTFPKCFRMNASMASIRLGSDTDLGKPMKATRRRAGS